MKAVISLPTLALLFGVAVLASCSDGDSAAAPSAAKPPTKAEYVERADAFCVQLGVELEELATSSFGEKPPTAAELRAYRSDGERLQNATVAKLRKLEPPAGDAATLKGIYDTMQRAFDAIAALPAGDPGTAGEEPAAIAQFERRARAYGLKRCATG